MIYFFLAPPSHRIQLYMQRSVMSFAKHEHVYGEVQWPYNKYRSKVSAFDFARNLFRVLMF